MIAGMIVVHVVVAISTAVVAPVREKAQRVVWRSEPPVVMAATLWSGPVARGGPGLHG